MIIVIPTYEPDEKLITLVKNLKDMCDFNILIIDDGSGENYNWIFQETKKIGCKVLSYDRNKGKGEALKTAFRYINLTNNDDVITADCDGQHLPEDIVKIANEITANKIILGTRHFKGKVPLRSSLGNKLTRGVFSIVSGKSIKDTQTGLRGFEKDILPWLCTVDGESYDYEMNVLLEAQKAGYDLKKIPINTVYLEDNKSSHFNPLKDSIKIYLPLVKFSGSSLICALVDFLLLMILYRMTSNLLFGVLGARACSVALNYSVNNKYVFSNKSKSGFQRYILLAGIIVTTNYLLIHLFSTLGMPLVISKLLTEGTLFFFSYAAQRKFVFR
ncbi:bifunctional glycosyltransferase family 2/GtrA family protein [Clostridium vincentii]|uniref:Undecaprenyl-phosphate mannosyltransferase n=1 Tax=Clostridium vincentii TaxID=52704 RepID=A0A2T0BDD6_9CLOT|nr:bifunctional glycosyltransferase family 2/GtrA family protein [Clostridium vincentii]PRR81852.1 Undecaprenyl-phosphate mannosyltransferase [Clostridium vincentii]